MKNAALKILLSLSTLWPAIGLLAQTSYLKSYAGDTMNWGRRLAATPDGGFIISSRYRVATLPTVCRMGLTKVDANGALQWSKKYGEIASGEAPEVISLNAGGFVGLTATTGSTFGQRDLFVLRLDDMGDTLWTRVYDHPMGVFGHDAVELANGDLVLATSTSEGFYLTRVNAQGAIVWSNGYHAGGLNGAADPEVDVMLSSDSAIVACGGMTSMSDSLSDGFLVKTDLNGVLQWTKFLGTEKIDGFKRVVETATGDYLAVGCFGWDQLLEDSQTMAARIASDGTLVWIKAFAAPEYEECKILELCPDGNYLVGGYIHDSGYSMGQLFKMTDAGELIWSNGYRGELGWWSIGFFDAVVVQGGLAVSVSMAQNFTYDPGLMMQDTIGASSCVMVPVPRTVVDTSLTTNDQVLVSGGVSVLSAAPAIYAQPLLETLHCLTTSATKRNGDTEPINVWPNPARDELFVVVAYSRVRAWMMDGTGRVCRMLMLDRGTNGIPLTGLGAGPYALRLETGEVMRFVKE